MNDVMLFGCCGCGMEIKPEERYLALSSPMTGVHNLSGMAGSLEKPIPWEGWVCHQTLECALRMLYNHAEIYWGKTDEATLLAVVADIVRGENGHVH